jgi:hypothetical protein
MFDKIEAQEHIYYLIIQLPLWYNPEAKCPKIVKFLEEVLTPIIETEENKNKIKASKDAIATTTEESKVLKDVQNILFLLYKSIISLHIYGCRDWKIIIVFEKPRASRAPPQNLFILASVYQTGVTLWRPAENQIILYINKHQ